MTERTRGDVIIKKCYSSSAGKRVLPGNLREQRVRKVLCEWPGGFGGAVREGLGESTVAGKEPRHVSWAKSGRVPSTLKPRDKRPAIPWFPM